VSDDDRELLKLGATFYWMLCRATASGGQRSLESIVRFRRLPMITRAELLRADEKADRWAAALGLDRSSSRQRLG
jgi:hypothetical protein